MSALDPTGHLAAQFPDLADILERMDSAEYPAKRRDVRVRFKSGIVFEATMSSAAAQRFIEDAAKSSSVASYSLGMEVQS